MTVTSKQLTAVTGLSVSNFGDFTQTNTCVAELTVGDPSLWRLITVGTAINLVLLVGVNSFIDFLSCTRSRSQLSRRLTPNRDGYFGHSEVFLDQCLSGIYLPVNNAAWESLYAFAREYIRDWAVHTPEAPLASRSIPSPASTSSPNRRNCPQSVRFRRSECCGLCHTGREDAGFVMFLKICTNPLIAGARTSTLDWIARPLGDS